MVASDCSWLARTFSSTKNEVKAAFTFWATTGSGALYGHLECNQLLLSISRRSLNQLELNVIAHLFYLVIRRIGIAGVQVKFFDEV